MSTPHKVFQKWLASLLLGIITLTGVLPLNAWASEPSERTAEPIEVIQSLPEANDPSERNSTEIIADEEIPSVVHSVEDETLTPTGENEATAPETKEAKEKTLGKEQESQAPPMVEAEDEEEPALEISDPLMSIQVLRASGYNANSLGSYSFTDQRGERYACPYITVNGKLAYCLENKKKFPANDSYIKKPYEDEGIFNIIYYAHQWGWDKPGANYVRTHIALNIQAGNMAYHVQDAGVDKLLQKAKDKTAPFGKLSISSPNQTATIGKTKRQVTDWYKVSGVKNTTLSFSLPSGVTLHTRDGKTQTGKVTLKGSQDFWLSAPLDKTVTVNTTVKTNDMIRPMFLFLPPRPELQQLVAPDMKTDPIQSVKISAKFFKRTGDLEGNKKDIETGQPLEGAVFVLKDGTKTIARATTDRNGKFVFKDIPMGDYTLHELKAPKNYRPLKSPKSITITPQQTTTVTITNEPMKAKIHITKVDDRDYQNEGVKPPLAGIVFEVLDPMGRLIQTLTTDKQGLLKVIGYAWIRIR
ncbi:prealbumin-like fold domain-containing protein [Allofustis seminis]|uniref:prealbumin-like fold domain-containing protein n=1 Tax=Allofustis seminis TaxID=166939 RepID=UPI00036DDA4E|nr:prealbumin-like fold domain-containing protein [Allofustis seminis]